MVIPIGKSPSPRAGIGHAISSSPDRADGVRRDGEGRPEGWSSRQSQCEIGRSLRKGELETKTPPATSRRRPEKAGIPAARDSARTKTIPAGWNSQLFPSRLKRHPTVGEGACAPRTGPRKIREPSHRRQGPLPRRDPKDPRHQHRQTPEKDHDLLHRPIDSPTTEGSCYQVTSPRQQVRLRSPAPPPSGPRLSSRPAARIGFPVS